MVTTYNHHPRSDGVVRVEDTPVDITVHFQRDDANDETQYAAIYKINGRKMTTRYRSNATQGREDALIGPAEAIGNDIGKLLLAGLINQGRL